jgi:metallo-beta-lactamase family protein
MLFSSHMAIWTIVAFYQNLLRKVSKERSIVPAPPKILPRLFCSTPQRFRHHLINNISREESTILFVGYQAKETLGRTILERAKQVRILGQQCVVRAKIQKINGFSAHADRDELARWLSYLRHPPRQVFVTHGEPEAATGFASWLREKMGWNVSVASYLEDVELE